MYVLYKEIAFGGDIAKVAVMPQSMEDVLTLLAATLLARRELPKTPLVTMPMGPLGSITRNAGLLFGLDLTQALNS
ncbi:MAG: type I 3-dehydroquinate dehydratase [Synergistaceae bacterium]|nr:type I 3-dehydroquinate dehydratase [Synergistaceae bacterium]